MKGRERAAVVRRLRADGRHLPERARPGRAARRDRGGGLRGHRARAARLPRRRRRAARAARAARPRADGRLVPDPLLQPEHLDERPRRSCGARSTCSRRRARTRRGRCSATAARPSALANPGRGKDDRLAAARRRRLDALRRRPRARRGARPRRAASRRSSTRTRARTSRRRPRSTACSSCRRSTCSSTPGHLLVGGSDPIQALRDWGPRVGYVHLKDARLDVVREVVAEGVGRRRGVAARRLLRARHGRRRPRRVPRRARARPATTAGCASSRTGIPRDDEPLSEAAEAQVRNRDWLRRRGL